MDAHATAPRAPTTPTIETRLYNEDGVPFGALLAGGLIVASDGRTFLHSDILNAPARTDAPSEDAGVHPAPAEPQAPNGELRLPKLEDLRFEWTANNKVLEAYDSTAPEATVARMRRGSGATVKLTLYVCPTAWRADLKMANIAARWAAVEEIADAFEATAEEKRHLKALLVKLTDAWLADKEADAQPEL